MAAGIVKPTRASHYGSGTSSKSFASVYRYVGKHPGKSYRTAGSGTRFEVTAQYAKRGKHSGKKVLIFRTEHGVERASKYSGEDDRSFRLNVIGDLPGQRCYGFLHSSVTISQCFRVFTGLSRRAG
jgi:hypothetical protein